MSKIDSSEGADEPQWLASLNPMQKTAVEMPEQHCLIIAGAGSGKTKVLTSRVAFLIETGMARPDEILAVTFTNKAAREMLDRLGHLGVGSKGMWVGTFHGLCNRFLRKFHKSAGLPAGFQILDVDDSKQVLKRLYKTKGWSEERLPIKDAYNFIASKKEAGFRPDSITSMHSMKDKLLKEVFECYEKQLIAEGAVDFPELMLKTVEMLQEIEPARFWFQSQFKHVLIDEFQDTNRLQYRWLKLITGETNPVFAVGDGDQSVYGFRGANIENIDAFIKEFKLGSDQLIRLEQNYRSKGNILNAANALIKNNKKRLEKNLWTDKEKGRSIHVKQAFDESEEAGFMAQEAMRLKEECVDLKEIAFLYRTNSQSRALEHALFRVGMPYRVYGGLRFFERAEIKNAMAYLRLAANKKDESALLRVINFPTRGVGAKTIEKYLALAESSQESLWDVLVKGVAKEGPKLKASLGSFIEIIETIEKLSKTESLAKLMQSMLSTTGLLDFYKEDEQAQDRIENLKELVNAARAFVSDPVADDSSLEAFLSHAALEAGEHGAKDGESAIQLMTVHASKGLEFDHVFIGGLEEGIFPHTNSLQKEEDIQEERRLMYVAITRARKELSICYAIERSQFGKTEANRPSRFLNELPKDLIRELQSSRSKEEIRSAQFKSAARGEKYSRGEGSYRTESTDVDYGKGSDKIADNLREKDDDDGILAVGKKVKHSKFGVGTVKLKQGRGDDLTVEVDFGSYGRRRLVAKYAKLTAA